MTALWLPGGMLGFDTETTGPDPTTARIVSATCVEVGPTGVVRRETWLVNPGVPIPEEASAIHGITDTMAAAGLDPSVAIPAIAAAVRCAWERGLPVVAMNATYDLTLLAFELGRLTLPFAVSGPVLDPLVIDRGADPYRRGGRKLVNLAAHYGVRLDGAHSSDGDALCAARIVWKQSRELRALQEHTLEMMQDWQAEAHEKWASGFEKYLRGKGDSTATIDRSWPIRRAA